MAHKKAGGSVRNGRDSVGQRLGIKAGDGQAVSAGTIIVRQRGMTFLAGPGTDLGGDSTLFDTKAGKAQVASAQAQVQASEIALNGVREEAKAGQRTTLDVLNAQQALVNARVALVTAQHDRVVASYSVLNTVGRLSPQVMNLPTTVYDPSVHYHQVRDSWVGVRTPDGR